MIKTKNLFLIVLICLGVTMTYTMNNSVAYADSNTVSSTNTKTQNNHTNANNTTAKHSIQNKLKSLTNISGVVTLAISFASILFLGGYYLYLTNNLNQMEIILLPLKERYKLNLVLPIMSIITFLLLIIITSISITSKDLNMLYTSVVFIICSFLLFILGLITMISHPQKVYIQIDPDNPAKGYYQIRYMIKDTYLSVVTPLDIKKSRIRILPISKIENSVLELRQKSTSHKIEILIKIFILAFILGLVISIPIFWLRIIIKSIIIEVSLTLILTLVFLILIIDKFPETLK